MKLNQHKEGKFPFHVVSSIHTNDASILNSWEFPNLVSALAFVIAELYSYKGKE